MEIACNWEELHKTLKNNTNEKQRDLESKRGELAKRLNKELRAFVRLAVAFSFVPDVKEVVFCPSYSHAVRNGEVSHKGSGGPLFFCKANASADLTQACISCLWLRVSIALEEPAILAWQRQGMETEVQRARADLAMTVASEQQSMLVAFAHDAKRLPIVLSGLLRAPLKPETTVRLSSTFSRYMQQNYAAFAALVPRAEHTTEWHQIADGLADQVIKVIPERWVSVREIFFRETALVILRTLVDGGGFETLAHYLWPDPCNWEKDADGIPGLSRMFWEKLDPILACFDSSKGEEFWQSLRQMIPLDIEVHGPYVLVPEVLEDLRPQPTLKSALSLIIGEILANGFSHTFAGALGTANCIDQGVGKRPSVTFNVSIDKDASPATWSISVSLFPGLNLKRPRNEEVLHGAGLKTLSRIAAVIGGKFSPIVDMEAGSCPWFHVQQNEGGVVNMWTLCSLPLQGVKNV